MRASHEEVWGRPAAPEEPKAEAKAPAPKVSLVRLAVGAVFLTVTLGALAAILTGALGGEGTNPVGDILEDAGFVIAERRGIGLTR